MTLPYLILAAAAESAGWIANILVVVGILVIAILVWLMRQRERQFALDLAEQERKANYAREEQVELMEGVNRESAAKSEMLATLSREVRAHLNGIIGSADIMLDQSLETQLRENLTTLRTSAGSLLQALTDVFEFAKLEEGRVEIAQEPFDLREPIFAVIDQVIPMAELKKLELVFILNPDVPTRVTGDAARLQQVFHGIMAYAVRHTTSGRVILRVEVSHGSNPPSAGGGTWMHFTVSGGGIPQDMQSRLFDGHSTPDTSSPRRLEGTELSLAICKRLVTLMGGQIGTRNIADSEAEFWITLPLPTDHTPRAEPVEAYAVVLDEITATRVATSALLTRLGVEQDATDTVANAISLLREAREDGATSAVLLVDESVLEGHAKELADQLAAEPVLADTHVVLLTRDPQKDTPPLKPTAIIRKPLLRIEVLQRALTGSGLAADSRPPFEGATSTEPAEEVRPLVLVVDDDEVSRFVTSQLLKRLGCEVELAASGAEAVEKTGQKRYALIFMDCQMPEMDGFATTERIRSGAARPPPIVALTANTAPEDRKRCFSVGMCDFIDKPVHKAELSRVLKRWVKSSAEA